MKFAKGVVKYRTAILIAAVILMIPALLGYLGTRVNYNMLDYLPDNMDTVIGQNELMEEFGALVRQYNGSFGPDGDATF